ncbi:alpha/beta fold hydrolase [Agromyces humatus]|uniref:Alpha/beta hydrolase n=1 Tax=Agromyces humatus TaxID=279573 RepID=A0ABN2KBP9_9MICO|nr:alpha/beta fold hydrolase [Agromyces humatus]
MSKTDVAARRTDGTVTSTDGVTIAFERSGSGPVVVLVAQALSDRRDNRKLAAALADEHTVVNYDRRGRGASTDAGDWSIQREIDDIEALIDEHGGSALLFGASSGAVLALDAAAALPSKVAGVVAYEAPVIVDDQRPPVPRELADRVEALVDDGRRSQAVAEFMKSALGAPGFMVGATRLMVPIWRSMVAMAPTTAYDLRLCAGLQDGTPLTTTRWKGVVGPVLVLVGGRGDPFMRTGGAALAAHLGVALEVVAGAHHATPMMKPALLVPTLERFFATSPGAD